jgi:hypothetical protein
MDSTQDHTHGYRVGLYLVVFGDIAASSNVDLHANENLF